MIFDESSWSTKLGGNFSPSILDILGNIAVASDQVAFQIENVNTKNQQVNQCKQIKNNRINRRENDLVIYLLWYMIYVNT